MPACPSCSQDNPTDANFCAQCGQVLVKHSIEPDPNPEPSPNPTSSTPTALQLWETFIGPSKSLQFSLKTWWTWRPAFLYYKDKFANLETPDGPRFALSWNWPAAFFDSFLWFLYRKMYMFALLYAVAPALAIFITGDMTVGIVSRILAGASANYLYYWHVKDKVQRIMSIPNMDDTARANLIREEGGVQPYVLWLGAALHVFMFGLLISAISQGVPEGGFSEGLEERPTPKFF
ncbi:MAG: DUF2628 domain-containing protein [Nitrospirales bacterium]